MSWSQRRSLALKEGSSNEWFDQNHLLMHLGAICILPQLTSFVTAFSKMCSSEQVTSQEPVQNKIFQRELKRFKTKLWSQEDKPQCSWTTRQKHKCSCLLHTQQGSNMMNTMLGQCLLPWAPTMCFSWHLHLQPRSCLRTHVSFVCKAHCGLRCYIA